MNTVFVLIPKSQQCQDWIAENIQCESWQKWNGGVAIGHHFIEGIFEALCDDGLFPEEDFSIIS